MATLETKSSHPLAAAIVNIYTGCLNEKLLELGTDLGLPDVRNFKNEEGMGLSGLVDEHIVLVGNLNLLKHYNVIVDGEHIQYYYSMLLDGYTVVLASVDGKVS